MYLTASTKSTHLFFTPCAHSETTMVIHIHEVIKVESVWLFGPHIRVRIALKCLNIHSTSLIQIKFLRFQQCLSLTAYAIPIFLYAQNYIVEVLETTGIDFSLQIPSERKCIAHHQQTHHHRSNLVELMKHNLIEDAVSVIQLIENSCNRGSNYRNSTVLINATVYR